jgi:hypothetical protein
VKIGETVMTKEEYIVKLETNRKNYPKVLKRKNEKYTKKAIKEITKRIKSADLSAQYRVSEEESRILFRSKLFDEKLEILKQKYDFLDIQVVKEIEFHQCKVLIYWDVKEKEACKYD